MTVIGAAMLARFATLGRRAAKNLACQGTTGRGGVGWATVTGCQCGGCCAEVILLECPGSQQDCCTDGRFSRASVPPPIPSVVVRKILGQTHLTHR
ncbi:hypothetical protein B0T26DRAFT_691493 [Lasiosphaeria miniovina]|uniref:Uncharacterized protein n=1 Tax=Lasiosphaeria miniovina TaxID=1954250 RepID=A0AA40B2X8_9PEZI|nr:uncharacterized protein B0T26DRAFT_691493 [Lasiosphaeria miniovina]KAK0726717.1 hypothetical protein B0T26DRAFT_691493 [Lasiosphaeria miniovina]